MLFVVLQISNPPRPGTKFPTIRTIAQYSKPLTAGADYLVTNDRHLLLLDPYEGLRIVSMGAYENLLRDLGLVDPDS
ncbi:MAG: hypothetical protein JWN51_871 [Phycisphaerales bacterium]|nr:hypothetical protein [Phycisphaerales bacterium]